MLAFWLFLWSASCPCTVSLISTTTSVPKYDVIIVGGSAAGLSAALSLGRSFRAVLVIDSGTPCNRFQSKSHNFLGNDGRSPEVIREQSLKDVSAYPSVQFLYGTVSQIYTTNNHRRKDTKETSISVKIEPENKSDEYNVSECRKLVIATGVQDLLPENLMGVHECWGKSVIHCPYCHGYEFANKRTALIRMKSSTVLTMAPILTKFTGDLYVIGRYDDESDSFTTEQTDLFQMHGIHIINHDVASINHKNGILSALILENGQNIPMDCAYLRPPCRQRIPLSHLLSMVSATTDLINEKGYIQVDKETQKTCIPNIYACGDCTDPNRSLSIALASGTRAAKMVNYELAIEDWLTV